MGRSRRFLVRLGVASATLVLVGVAVEVVFRCCVPPHEAPPVRMAFANRLAEEAEDLGSVFAPSPTRFWELRPGAVDPFGGDPIHAHGMRGTVPNVGRGRRFRIAVVGDSCTYGVNTLLHNTWGARLEERLGTGHVVEVLNAGVPGYTLYQSGVLFEERLAPLAPDLVVLHVGAWNDAGPALGATDRERGEFGVDGRSTFERAYEALDFLSSVRWAGARFAGALRYRHWVRAREAWEAGAPIDGYRVGLDDFRVLLDRLLDGCARVGSDVLVVLPEVNVATEAQGLPSRALLEGYREVLARAAAERDLVTVDQRALFPEALHDELFVDGVHPSVQGHLWLGRRVAEEVVRHPRFREAPAVQSTGRGDVLAVARVEGPSASAEELWTLEVDFGAAHAGEAFVVEASRRPFEGPDRPLAADPELADLARAVRGERVLDEDGRAELVLELPRRPGTPAHAALEGRRVFGLAVRREPGGAEAWSDVLWIPLGP